MTGALDPATRLVRAPTIRIELSDREEIVLIAGDGRAKLGPMALHVLASFDAPRALGEVLDELASVARDPRTWAEVASLVRSMLDAELLVRADAEPPSPRAASRYAVAGVHVAMLDDEARTRALLAAIVETVKPGDVVVDIGTGTGVLAIAAARAGARRVFAVEASPVAALAERVIAANGVADRVRVIRGWSTRVELPERCDVLVTETIGDDPFGEQILEIVTDARRRHLKAGARIVPRRLRVIGVPLALGDDARRKNLFTARGAREWSSRYGIDFAPLAESPRWVERLVVATREITGARVMAEDALLGDVDLASVETLPVEMRATTTARCDGAIDGLYVCFEAELSESVTLSTHPACVAASNSWRPVVVTLPEPLVVRAGDRLDVRYRPLSAMTADSPAIALAR